MTPSPNPADNTFSYLAIARAIEVRQLQTHLDTAEWVDVDEPPRRAALRLAASSFDQAPVRRGTSLVGYVLTKELRGSKGRTSRRVLHPLDASIVLSAGASVLDLLEVFDGGLPMSFVVDGHKVTGFVTPSDLNKHQARAHFYLLLADLEMRLATLIRAEFPNQEVAVAVMPKPDDRKKVRSRFARDRRSGVEVDLVAGMDLGHMLSVAAQTERMRSAFGSPDVDDWNLWTQGFSALRDAVMHPVLEFLGAHRTVSDLARAERTIRSMLAASEIARPRNAWGRT